MATLVDTDPELLRQLNSVSADAEPVEAVFRLRPEHPSQVAASPEKTEQLVRRLLERVKRRVGGGAEHVNVLRNLGLFVVSARPAFLYQLITQPEIASAMANRQPGEILIPPRNRRPASTSKARARKRSHPSHKTGC